MPRPYYKSHDHIRLHARELRKNLTISEKIIWFKLRKRQLSGYRFLRQHPIVYREIGSQVKYFIADFYCAELNLIIEVDGPIHNWRKEYDRERDEILNLKGIKVLRIENEDTEKAITLIKDFIEKLKVYGL